MPKPIGVDVLSSPRVTCAVNRQLPLSEARPALQVLATAGTRRKASGRASKTCEFQGWTDY